MGELFGVQVPAISKHLKNIFESSELKQDSVVSKMETTASDWKRYQVKYYNLDAIIAVGYRVNSMQATQFRIRANKILKEYIIKGFAMDDERLKNGQYFGKDYFDELLERVRSIRTSERRIYLKITDIFAECSIDYDGSSSLARDFFAWVQNKFHYAISWQTAAEIIHDTVDRQKDHMWLTTWKHAPKGRILKSDVSIAKNYLSLEQIKELEKTVSMYFDYIETRIKKRKEMTMQDLSTSVIAFLEFNEFEILEGKWSISHTQAKRKAEEEYDVYNKTQHIGSDFENFINTLPQK